MYWADWTKTTIMTTDKDIGLGLEYIVNNTYHVSDLKIYSKTSQSCKLQSFSSSLISLCFQFWSFGMIKINLHCDYNMYIFTGHSKLNAVKTIPLAMSKYCIEIDSTFVVLRTYRVSIWFFQLIFLPDLRCSVLTCNFLFQFCFCLNLWPVIFCIVHFQHILFALTVMEPALSYACPAPSLMAQEPNSPSRIAPVPVTEIPSRFPGNRGLLNTASVEKKTWKLMASVCLQTPVLVSSLAVFCYMYTVELFKLTGRVFWWKASFSQVHWNVISLFNFYE